jgi:GNAT superfamily N-acetyltransferase
MLHDAPRKNQKLQRRWEIVARDTTKAAEVMRCICAARPARFALCVVHAGDGRRPDIEAAYKALGMRYIIHEPIFVRKILPVSRSSAPAGVSVARVKDLATARRIARAARRGQIREQDLADNSADHRLYAALVGESPVGWVSSIRTHPNAAWVANLYVQAEHRRRGIGAALMCGMLRDDAARGIRHSVLTASQAGAALYRTLKYHQAGTLQVFVPRRS